MAVRYKDKAWREDMRITLDFNNLMAGAIGDEHGISEGEIDKLTPRAEEIGRKINRDSRWTGEKPFTVVFGRVMLISSAATGAISKP